MCRLQFQNKERGTLKPIIHLVIQSVKITVTNTTLPLLFEKRKIMISDVPFPNVLLETIGRFSLSPFDREDFNTVGSANACVQLVVVCTYFTHTNTRRFLPYWKRKRPTSRLLDNSSVRIIPCRNHICVMGWCYHRLQFRYYLNQHRMMIRRWQGTKGSKQQRPTTMFVGWDAWACKKHSRYFPQ